MNRKNNRSPAGETQEAASAPAAGPEAEDVAGGATRYG